MKSLRFVVILSLFFSMFTLAQDIPALKFDRITSEKITIEKGLSQNSGLSITQDDLGFMWFGTWDGLNRFDGYEFLILNNESGLSHNTIRSLHQDKEMNLWIGTEGGLDRLDLNTGHLEVYRNVPGQMNSLGNDFILEIVPGINNDLWLCTAGGLNNYDLQNDVFREISFFDPGSDSLQSNYINCAFVDQKKNLWIGTNSGLHCYDLVHETFTAYYTKTEGKQELSSPVVTDITVDDSGQIWVGTTQGLNRIDPITGHIKWFFKLSNPEHSLFSNTINVVFYDSKGTLWVGTPEGLNVYDPELDRFLRYGTRSDNTSISNNDIRSIFEDRSGTIWIGTYKGINKIDRSSSRFTHYRHDAGDPQSLSNDIIYSIKEDQDGNAWIATYGGLNVMDRQKNQFNAYRHKPGRTGGLVSDKLRVVEPDRDGRIWIGTESSGLQSFDPSTGQFTTWVNDPLDSLGLVDNRIVSLQFDLNGRLWVGTRNGLVILDPSSGSFDHSLRDPANPDAIPNPIIWTLFRDSKGRMWVGTDDGLYTYDGSLNLVLSYIHIHTDPKTISGNRIMTINEDRDGNFWVGTIGDGLNFLDMSSGEIKYYKEKDGLPNNVVYSALEDMNGHIWISTNWGLTRFDREYENFVLYDVKDGVQGNEFNGGAYYQNRQGEMYFGGMNGLNVFHPNDIRINETVPKMVITDFFVFNEPLPGTINDRDTILLNHDDNFFSIKFAALEYTNPSKNVFRFKMENYDDDWTTRGAGNRQADYRKVRPGNYVFRVIGANNDGIWNNDGVSLVIIIKPPWWETWAFRIPFALFIILMFWSIIFWRFKTLKNKHEVERKVLEIEKQVFELEQKALRLQMNPHFIFNSLNAIQSFVIANDTDKAIPYLAKFSHLMRMILANSSESYIPLKDEMKALRYYMDLERLRFDESFDYFIDLDEEIDDDFIEIPPMMLQPYVENAIIHGLNNKNEKGRLLVKCVLKDKAMICIIEDNGIGREKAREIREMSGIRRQPRGMMITRERLEIMKRQNKQDFFVRVEDLKDDKGNPTGTRVKIAMHYREI